MVIRDNLMVQLRQGKLQRFEAFASSLLKREFPERCAMTTDKAIQDDIKRHTMEADTLGIKDENSVAKFIYLKWLLGEKYERFLNPAWLTGLIGNRSRPAIQRMDIALAGVARHLDAAAE